MLSEPVRCNSIDLYALYKTTNIFVKVFLILLTVAHSFNPYVVPSTAPEKSLLLGSTEESLEIILVNLLKYYSLEIN